MIFFYDCHSYVNITSNYRNKINCERINLGIISDCQVMRRKSITVVTTTFVDGCYDVEERNDNHKELRNSQYEAHIILDTQEIYS